MSDEVRFSVGDRVILRDVNEKRMGGPAEGTVSKVGRTLVTVTNQYGRDEKYRIEDGQKNDQWGHGWIETLAEHEERNRRHALVLALRENGIDLRYERTLTIARLEALLAVFDDDPAGER